MPWLQLSLDASDLTPERLEQALMEAGAQAVTLQDAADQPLYEPAPGAHPLWARIRVIGLFPADADMARVQQNLRQALGRAELPGCRVEPLEDRDWTRAWMDHFRPMRFGTRLWICPRDQAPPDRHAVNLRLDPGLAFGTGTHATTALCLEWLDQATLHGQRVIDYGCGSGVLAIAALLLGARMAWAVDNDPQALQATRRNAEDNGVVERIAVCPPEALAERDADLLLANILAGPLIALAPDFSTRVRTGGTLVLSGILQEQACAVMLAYAPWFALEQTGAREGWVRLSGARVPS
ncbi:MAG: 50S ribosomal protein L11 methyltransferase [Gammaproteobacteria bacterium]|nr:50S ribosomal protein L11 methyltransferase [Gammaproteobacteria bacterium]